MAQTKEEFINENIVIKQRNNGDFYIGSISCSVFGDVEGNVEGNVEGEILGFTR